MLTKKNQNQMKANLITLLSFFLSTFFSFGQDVIPDRAGADSSLENTSPYMSIDEKINTRWLSNGKGKKITYSFNENITFNGLKIAFYASNARESEFNLEISNDSIAWTAVGGKFISTKGFSNSELEAFSFPTQNAKHIRLICQGNNINEFNSIYELKVTLTENTNSQEPTNESSKWEQSDNNISYTNGNVGIGTTNPLKKLHIYNTSTYEAGYIHSNQNGTLLRYRDKSNKVLEIGSQQGDAVIRTDGEVRVNVESGTGDVGIGITNTKGFKLGVNGKIAATEVKVALYNNWSDFVFYDDYKLPTLTEVEEHIREKGHLKDIPSAAAVAKNGIFLGEMDAKLLQKIEELTLYTIDQEKRIAKQDSKLEKQEKEIEKLKTLVTQLLEANK